MNPTTALRHCTFAITAAALACSSAQAGAPRFAWGKAGISYDQYRAEAFECAIVGLDTNIDNTEPVERLRNATRELEALDNRQSVASSADPVGAGINHAQDLARMREAARPDQQVKEVKKILFSAMQQCMIQRGYTRFALTEDQRDEIDKLKDGSQERRAYIHKLASDPAVLDHQKQPLPVK